MKIRTKLLLSYGLITILFIATGVLTMIANRSSLDNLLSISSKYEDSKSINKLEHYILKIQETFLASYFENNSSDAVKEISALQEEIGKLADSLNSDKLIKGEGKGDPGLNEVLNKLPEFVKHGKDMMAAFSRNDSGAYNMEFKAMDSLYDSFMEKMDNLQQKVDAGNIASMKKQETSLKFVDRLTLVIILIASILVFFLSFGTTKAFISPLMRIIEISNEISVGNLRSSVSEKGKDEYSLLGKNLNNAIGHLKQSISNMQIASQSNVDIKNNMTGVIEKTSTATDRISNNTESMKDQVNVLNGNVKNSTGSVLDIDSRIASLGNLIEDQTAMVVEATASITQMIESVKRVADISESKKSSIKLLVETSAKGGAKLDGTNEVIQNVAGMMEDIQEMVEIINSIASQTNLLSMNAAIEAAHAGDSGRGFAVVADEIRKLAENTTENAHKIGLVIGNITENIAAATVEGSETKKAFEEIQNEVIVTEQALNEITEATGELSMGGEEIHKAMVQLSEVSENISRNAGEIQRGSQVVAESMNNLESISTSVTTGINEITQGTNEILDSVNYVHELTGRLGENAENLDQMVKNFTV